VRYGFIGLGNLGKHLAASLLREGFDLTVYDLNCDAARKLIAGGVTGSVHRAVTGEITVLVGGDRAVSPSRSSGTPVSSTAGMPGQLRS
jgi:3-hydroxyisobutyrate dehydrogenase-like beta-hydroxyacid dehydrogenase